MYERIKHINPKKLNISSLRDVVTLLLNVVEEYWQKLEDYKKETQELKDEINRLKKEQGKPIFKEGKKEASDEEEEEEEKAGKTRKVGKKKNNKRGAKKPKIPIDKIELCRLEKAELPQDAVFKYYDTVIQQDVDLVRNNVLYKVAVYYSPSARKTYRGKLPSEYVGEFGLGIRSLTQLLHQFCDTTQGRLEALYKSLGVLISSGTINNIILSSKSWVLSEQRAILKSGIAASSFTQADSTKSVERGVRKATQIICGDYFSVFYTMDSKSRLDVIRALLGKPEEGLRVTYNQKSIALLDKFKVSLVDKSTLATLITENEVMSLVEFEQLLARKAPKLNAKKNISTRIKESLVLGYYHHQQDFPIVNCLLSDDAPEYKKIAANQHGLCWIHDNRFYKKLVPRINTHRAILEETQQEYWTFYSQLLDYKELTTAKQRLQKKVLLEEFERIFSKTTDYFQVNTCLERTYKNKTKLLAVLENPALPLHNNAAELAARRIVRKRDISLHTWSPDGTKVRDAFMSIIQTAIKLEVSPLQYIKDRISQRYEMTPLDVLVSRAYC